VADDPVVTFGTTGEVVIPVPAVINVQLGFGIPLVEVHENVEAPGGANVTAGAEVAK
jgi:hypothetical protein